MAINHPIHRHSDGLTESSSRPKTLRQRPVVLLPVRYVECDDAHQEAALSALADLLAPYLAPLRAEEGEAA
jgi:hypothetical protein